MLVTIFLHTGDLPWLASLLRETSSAPAACSILHTALAWSPHLPCARSGTQQGQKLPRPPAHRDLDSQQAFPCILRINGELHRQAGGHTGGVEPRAAGFHLAGVVRRQHLDLEGAVCWARGEWLGKLLCPACHPQPGSELPLTCGALPLPRTSRRCCRAPRGWARS